MNSLLTCTFLFCVQLQVASQGKVFSTEAFSESLDRASDNILYYAILLAAVATVTMSLVELFKAVFRVRYFYHKAKVKNWVVNPEVLNELVHLSIGDQRLAAALYDQPTEKMMGQIQAASNIALDYPHVYPHLYTFLTQPEEQRSFPEATDSYRWAKFAMKIDPAHQAEGNIVADRDDAGDDDRRAATQSRARIDHLTGRRLDAFQLRTEFVWSRLNQSVAIIASMIFIYIILVSISPEKHGINFLLSIAGGLIAPLAKDVVSALSGLRTKR